MPSRRGHGAGRSSGTARPTGRGAWLAAGDLNEIAREAASRVRAASQVRDGLITKAIERETAGGVHRCPTAVVRSEERIASGVVLSDVLADPDWPVCDVERRRTPARI